MKTFLTCTCSLTVALCLVAGVAGADTIVVPESWAGIWETTTTEMDCETREVKGVTTTTDTLCAGDILNPEDPDGEFPDLVCEGTANDTTFHLDCSGSMEIFPGCNFTLSFVSDGTRNGDNSIGVNIMTTTFDAACGFPGDCVRRESVAVRTSADSDCGLAPVDASSWGTLKSNYR